MTLSETTTMATDTSSTGNHTHESMEERPDDFIGQQLEKQEQSDGPTQQDKLRQRTLALVKPDAVQANHQQAIIDKIISAGFTIIQQKQVQFTLAQACLFYREHENKSFYDQLTEWMSSAPIYAMILEKENAIQDWRTLMGPTNAIKAREIDPTSIRALFGTDGSHNATHGSDCLTSADREIDIVFGSAQNLSTATITTDDIVVQSDLSTADASIVPSTDHDGFLLEDNTSNKEQFLATTSKETDSSGDDGLDTKATTATDDIESFVPPTAATPLDTSNDVEHPVITSDSLSHPASPDHDDAQHNNDAPTCPKSGFVELPSGDNHQSATVTTANTIQDEHLGSTATKADVQEPISEANTDNKAPAHVNSNTDDETLEEKEHGSQNDAECSHNASLSNQHQQQEPSSPVTENLAAKDESVVESSTPDNTHNEQQQSGGDKDQIASLDSAGPDIAHIAENVGGQEKEVHNNTSAAPSIAEESTTKASETSTTSTADDNITQTIDHGMDSTVDNDTTNDDNAIDEPSGEQQFDQDLKKVEEDDDCHNITPEQETESLSIQEASTAATPTTTTTTTIDMKDIKDEKENDQSIDTTLAAVSASDDTKSTDVAPVESTIHDSDKALDKDKQELAASQDTKDKIGECHDGDDGDINTTEGNFDTIPLAADEEESKGAVAVNNTPIAEETTTTTVIESTTPDVTVLKPTTDAVENASIPVAVTPDITVLKPNASAENTSIPVAVTESHIVDDDDDDDALIVEQEPVVDDEPESGKEPNNVAGEPEFIEKSIPEVAVADESESTPQQSIPEVAAVAEHESTKESTITDELEASSNPPPVDTVADGIEHPKKPSADDELQVTESSKVVDEPEPTKEYVTNTDVDGLSEPVEEQTEHAEAPHSQNTAEIEPNDMVEPTATDKPVTTETQTDDKNQNDAALTTTASENEPKSVPNDDDHQGVSDEDDQATEIKKETVDKADSVSSHDEDSAVDGTKATKSDEEPVKEKKVASTSPPASTTRSPLRKSPTGTAKTPVKSTSPPATTKKSPTSGTGSAKPATASRLRRPGTTPATGTGSSATTATGTGVKKTTPKTSTSPGRTPLPRVATLAKKPVTKTTDESKTTTETKPATTKKRSSVISRLTAPTAASANKRTSEAAASSTPTSTAKATSGNGTTRARVTSTSGHHAPGTSGATTRRPASKVSTATDKPTTTARRTSPSSTADKTSTTTTRRISPPSSTTVHSKAARSTTAAPASSSRLSSTTTKSPSTDATTAKRSPTRRVSPPTSTHLASATKPTTKVSKPTTTEKKTDVIRKKAKPSGTTTAAAATTKTVNKEKKDDDSAHVENSQSDNGEEEHGENIKKANEETSHPATEEEQHDESLDHEVITSEQPSIVEATIQQEETTAIDAEVNDTTTQDGTTLNPTTTDSSTKRPRTPEMAQLRNKFENLQAPTTVTPTRSTNKQPSSAPHNIKDLISRFN